MSDELDELRRTIRALAQPFQVQVSLFPDFVALGDELVIEHAEAMLECRRANIEWTEPQARCLAELDAFIESISGEQFSDLWLDPECVRSDLRWARIRRLAKAVLDAFGWTNEAPSPNPRAFYVREPE